MCTYFLQNLEKFVQNMAGVPSVSNSPLVSRIMPGFTRYNQTNHHLISVTFSIFLANNQLYYFFKGII